MGEQGAAHTECLFGKADAAGAIVINDEGGLVCEGAFYLIGYRNIPGTAHEIQRTQDAQQIGNPQHTALQIIFFKGIGHMIRQGEPAGSGVHIRFRQPYRAKAHIFVIVKAHFLEDFHQRRDLYFAKEGVFFFLFDVQQAQRHV